MPGVPVRDIIFIIWKVQFGVRTARRGVRSRWRLNVKNLGADFTAEVLGSFLGLLGCSCCPRGLLPEVLFVNERGQEAVPALSLVPPPGTGPGPPAEFGKWLCRRELEMTATRYLSNPVPSALSNSLS